LPAPDKALTLQFKMFVKNWLAENLPHAEVLDFEEWLASTSYTEVRKAELRSVHLALHGGVPTRKQARKIKAFVKTESYFALKLARMINSRVDAAKVFIGPRAKAVERVVYALDAFIKHTPVADRPALIATLRKSGCRYYLSDYTAFESHFTAEFMDICECELYRHVLKNDEHVQLMCRILTGQNLLSTHTGVRCKLAARRMSGDMVTSVGNGFTNYMLSKFVATLKGDPDLQGFVEGDDGIFSTPVEITESDFSALGFTCKLVEVNDPCECIPLDTGTSKYGSHAGAFCGVCCTQGGEMIRDPRAFFQTFGWTSSFINAKQSIMDQLARAKALSACMETPQCPIIGAMGRRVLRETVGVVPRFVEDGYHTFPRDEIKVPPFWPSPECRLLFEAHFGIPVAIQLAVEKRVSTGDFDIADLVPPTPDQAWFYARFVERS
jgi:hypothetical protein